MEFLYIFFIALGLSADCFAVAISGSISLRNPSSVQVLRTALAFGLSQFLMPIIGWLAGQTVVSLIAAYDHWVALALLVLVGGRMLWESFHSEEKPREADITRGVTLLTMSVATSIDALAVGLSLAFLHINIWVASLIIGAVAFGVTVIGFFIGKKVSAVLGRRAKLLSGVILIAIGLRILLSHIL